MKANSFIKFIIMVSIGYSFFSTMSFARSGLCTPPLAIRGNALGGDGENVYLATKKGIFANSDSGDHWNLMEWNITYPNRTNTVPQPIPIEPIKLVSLNNTILIEYYRDTYHHLAISLDKGLTFRDLDELSFRESGGFYIAPNNQIIIGGYWCPHIAKTKDIFTQICVSDDLGKTWQTLKYTYNTNTILKVGNNLYMGQCRKPRLKNTLYNAPILEYADFTKPPKDSIEWEFLFEAIESITLATAGDSKTIYVASLGSQGLLVSEDNGKHWYKNLRLLDFVPGIAKIYANFNDVYVSLSNKNILALSHDKGLTWNKVIVPKTPGFVEITDIYATKKNIYIEITGIDSTDHYYNTYMVSNNQGLNWSEIHL